jgi:hypothetical protein
MSSSSSSAVSTPTGRPANGTRTIGRPAAINFQQRRLLTEDSSRRTDELIAELAALTNSDEATVWAQRVLPEKNRLQVEDATRLEEAFSQRKSELDRLNLLDPSSADILEATPAAEPTASPSPSLQPRPASMSALSADPPRSGAKAAAEPEPQPPLVGNPRQPSDSFPHRLPVSPPSFTKITRRRDAEHLRFVASQACMICARQPSDAHHLRFAQVRAFGRKVSDEFTVPLCRTHHREVHRASNERDWWARLGIKPLNTARLLWRQSHHMTGTASRPAQATVRKGLNGSGSLPPAG